MASGAGSSMDSGQVGGGGYNFDLFGILPITRYYETQPMLANGYVKDEEVGIEFEHQPHHTGRWVIIAILVLVGFFALQRAGIVNSALVKVGLSRTKIAVLSRSKVKIGYPTQYIQISKVTSDALGLYGMKLAESQSCKDALLQQTDTAQQCIYVTVQMIAKELVESEDVATTSMYRTKTNKTSTPYTMAGHVGTFETFFSKRQFGSYKLEEMQQYVARILIPYPKTVLFGIMEKNSA